MTESSTRPHRFYVDGIAPIISDLSIVVISVGVITAAIRYAGLLFAGHAMVQDPEFWVRLLATLSVVAFTAYNVIAYRADILTESAHSAWAKAIRSPLRLILMFFLDLAALGIQAFMYGVTIPRWTARPDAATDVVSAAHLTTLAGLAAGWHLIMVIWHPLAGSERRDTRDHALFALMFFAFALLSHFWKTGCQDNRVAALAIFMAIVSGLILYRARALVHAGIEELTQPEDDSSAPPAKS